MSSREKESVYNLPLRVVQNALRQVLTDRLLQRYKKLREEGREAFALNYLAEENKLQHGFGVGLREHPVYMIASMVVNAALGREQYFSDALSGFDDKPEHVVLGFWKDPVDGYEWIDYGVVIEKLPDAVAVAATYKQKAIYSFEYDCDIRLDEDLGNHHGLPLIRCLHCDIEAVCPQCYPTGVCIKCMSPQEVHKHPETCSECGGNSETGHQRFCPVEDEHEIARLEDEGGLVFTVCAYCDKKKWHVFWCPTLK